MHEPRIQIRATADANMVAAFESVVDAARKAKERRMVSIDVADLRRILGDRAPNYEDELTARLTGGLCASRLTRIAAERRADHILHAYRFIVKRGWLSSPEWDQLLDRVRALGCSITINVWNGDELALDVDEARCMAHEGCQKGFQVGRDCWLSRTP